MNRFRQIWAVDFEFIADTGERPLPVCLVARELRSGRLIRRWRDQFGDRPPYSTGCDSLFVAYFASAELGCHLALGWPLPVRVLDLFAEFRNLSNGLPLPLGRGLIGALAHYGLDAMAGAEKGDMRRLILRGGPWSPAERRAILAYCQTDVDAVASLLPRMWMAIARRPGDLERAQLRGRYTAAVARMEHAGIPVTAGTLERLRRHWAGIKQHLVGEVDRDYGIYDGNSFRVAKFADYLGRHGIPWPRTDTGRLALDDDTFREQARSWPEIAPLRQLRHALSEARLQDLAVGQDGRNRVMLSPFGARTGRNTPSNTRFLFGPAVWLRGLVKPDPGRALAYVDWSQQEVGIAAALSGDPALLEAVGSGDPYLAFAVQAKLAPPDATKATHGQVRDACKACVLGIGYGMAEIALAGRIGCSAIEARELLELHRRTYPTFWRWSDAAIDHAMIHGRIETVFGWRLQVGADANARSLRNFPMQANGAEMLRLACCLASERSVTVCAPVHDAILIEAPEAGLEEAVAIARQAMAEASRAVLGGFDLATEAKVITWPDRYSDPRGEIMWRRVTGILDRIEAEPRVAIN